MSKKVIATPNAPAAVGPYSQGWIAGDFIYTAGQGGLNPATGESVRIIATDPSGLVIVEPLIFAS